MKDIPVFDTAHGVASLFLREIPYRGRAHIKILSSLEPDKLLEECVAFCRMCGAEWCDAAGHEYLEKFPLITSLLLMRRDRHGLDETDACLFPVTEENITDWVRIYNERMAEVPNCAWMDSTAGKELLRSGGGYFVHRDGKLLGIGSVCGDRLETVIDTEPGMGETVVLALSSLIRADTVTLQVAAANTRALRLYERMGFVAVRELSRWYRVL